MAVHRGPPHPGDDATSVNGVPAVIIRYARTLAGVITVGRLPVASCSGTCCWRCPRTAWTPVWWRKPTPPAQRQAGLDNYPQLARLEPELRQDHSEEEFQESLEKPARPPRRRTEPLASNHGLRVVADHSEPWFP